MLLQNNIWKNTDGGLFSIYEITSGRVLSHANNLYALHHIHIIDRQIKITFRIIFLLLFKFNFITIQPKHL